MKERLQALLKYSEDEVVNTHLIIELFRIYSIIYAREGQPSLCTKCARDYYRKLKKNGLEMAEIEKKNVCKLKGIRYVNKAARDFDLQNLTDADATFLIKNRILQESDFKVLPYEAETTKTVNNEISQNRPSKKNRRKSQPGN